MEVQRRTPLQEGKSFSFYCTVSKTDSTWYVRPLFYVLYQPRMMDDKCVAISGMGGRGEGYEKACPSATLSTTNPTYPAPGSNPGRRGGKAPTNRLSCDMTR
jgi:hypothetical protein